MIGIRQSDPLSLCLFITYQERVMDGVQDNGTGITVQRERINNLRFADGMNMIEESLDQLRENVGELEKTGSKAGLK